LNFHTEGKEITELWMDYEANSSPEAKFVKDLDKVCGFWPNMSFSSSHLRFSFWLVVWMVGFGGK
jgi:5'-deoxynucleotidase YfbR-like HD superfamily hydrolase